MPTIFSQIAEGTIPSHMIYGDDTTCAFLDINPVSEGHTLVIPRQEIDHLEDCPPELYVQIFGTVHKVSKRLKEIYKPERIGIIVHGFDVPHAHVHVIPIYHNGDVSFPDRLQAEPDNEKLALVANKLKIK